MTKKRVLSLAMAFAGLMSLPSVSNADEAVKKPVEHASEHTEKGFSFGLPADYLVISLGSLHFGRKEDGQSYNNFNPGLGLERSVPFYHGESGGELGLIGFGEVFYNSDKKVSLSAGVGIEGCLPLKDRFAACSGVLTGLVSGNTKSVEAIVQPYVKLEDKKYGIFSRAGFVPGGLDGNAPNMMTFDMGIRF